MLKLIRHWMIGTVFSFPYIMVEIILILISWFGGMVWTGVILLLLSVGIMFWQIRPQEIWVLFLVIIIIVISRWQTVWNICGSQICSRISWNMMWIMLSLICYILKAGFLDIHLQLCLGVLITGEIWTMLFLIEWIDGVCWI